MKITIDGKMNIIFHLILKFTNLKSHNSKRYIYYNFKVSGKKFKIKSYFTPTQVNRHKIAQAFEKIILKELGKIAL